MKKSMIYISLLTLCNFYSHAESNTPSNVPATTPPVVIPFNASAPTAPAATTAPIAAPNATVTNKAPATPTTEPTSEPTSAPEADTAKPSPNIINCHYHIPAQTTQIEPSLVLTWGENAVKQSFDLNPSTLDQQLQDLKECFTDEGWQSYSEALQKSGNINSIRSQQLTVTNDVDGKSSIKPAKENQWNVSIPLKVVYQNNQEKITQMLTVDLLVGRKISGDLGIMQVLAAPRPVSTPVVPEPAATPKPSPDQNPAPAANPVPAEPAKNETPNTPSSPPETSAPIS